MQRNRIWSPVLAALFLTLGGGTEAWGQAEGVEENVDNTQYGTRAAEFLLLPVGARATALGQAFTAIADDATALYWNPAGLGFLTQPSAHVTYYAYPANTSYTWGGVAVPIGLGGWVVGVQVGVFDFGEQPVYTVLQPEGTGATYSNSMFVAGVSAALNVSDRFSFGVTGKLVNESFAQTDGSTLGVDIGTNYHTTVAGRSLRAAFTILNLGGEIELAGPNLTEDFRETDPTLPDRRIEGEFRTQPFPIPTMFKVGLGYDVLETPTSRLTVAGEFWQPQQNKTAAAGGFEYMLSPPGASGFSFALRGGYTYEGDRSFDGANGESFDDKGSDGLTGGGGIGWRSADEGGFRLWLDYAYRNLGLLGNTDQFSASISW